ncbi:MAG: hypothetical protein EOO50_13365 [Flavobacterium sp.]|uniref:hypothetical protein n=1 Tax=Flavobacterium sp. TaxID=239 RepID=UPI0011F955FE|nr:hypothetical protein [Flavobacterium sp.]RZJ65530.1 MAG: hypothetical protein EOO50_13365 [Flavobacterium sp.]
MRAEFLVPVVFLLTLSTSCEQSKKTEKSQTENDSASTIVQEIIKPKKYFDLHSTIKNGDTLSFVTCSEFVYSPFGDLKSKASVESGLLKRFSVTNRIDTVDIGPVEFQTLTSGNSHLLIYLPTSLLNTSRGKFWKYYKRLSTNARI